MDLSVFVKKLDQICEAAEGIGCSIVYRISDNALGRSNTLTFRDASDIEPGIYYVCGLDNFEYGAFWFLINRVITKKLDCIDELFCDKTDLHDHIIDQIYELLPDHWMELESKASK